jgi:hypothetical protein
MKDREHGQGEGPVGTQESDSEGIPFDDTEDLKGFNSLSKDLSPEVRELALAMRRLLKATGKSLRAFAVYHHLGAGTVSRYLSGERLPEQLFLDVLMKDACSSRGQDVIADVQGHLYRLYREALLAMNPARYREQMASDRLEDAILQKEQAELQIHELQSDVSERKRQLREAQAKIQQIGASYATEQQHLGAELELYRRQKEHLDTQCEQLRERIQDLEYALEEAVRERDAAQSRCVELETELATAQDLAEREELKRQAAEEQLRLAKATNIAERHLGDLERIQREAEQMRTDAARDAAVQREEAEATAKKIIEEASTRVTKIRPSMVPRSAALRRLRDAAVGIAEHRLPMLVDQLSRDDPGRVDTRVAPIPIDTRDEIGEVARAFDQVHREAVRLAAEQALLRAHSRAIFANLSRRNQTLIASQLALLTDLENSEAAPDRLTSLYRLDHLATRMRRNTETLLTLAGETPGRRWDQPIPLLHVLLAACSEAEQYERITLSGIPEAEIHGRAVTDLVHVLAELLENATTFSSPQTRVRVAATHLPDGRIVIEIHDKGIGLTTEDYNDINHTLANPPTVDAAISQRMGLFIVGRLSGRHGIRVQFRPAGEEAGTTSLVMLPTSIVPRKDGQPPRKATTVSPVMPMQHPSQQQDVNTM